MKNLFILITLLLLLPAFVRSQNLEEGNEQFRRARYESAEVTFHSVLKSDPANSEAWAMLMRTYVQLGKSKQASDSLAFTPGYIKKEPHTYIANGVVLLSKKESNTAKGNFQKAIALTKGKNSAVLSAIADANIESPYGDYHYAIELLRMAIKRDKKNAALHTSMGKAYRKLHNGSEAYKSFMHAINKNDNEAAAYYELGSLFLSQKNTELYTQYFKKAIESDPQFGPAYYEMYKHYLFLDPSKAKDYFLQYVKNSDHSTEHEYSYADLLYLTKNYDSAILSARKLIRTQGDNVHPRLYKMVSYSLQEKADTIGALNYMIKYFDNAAESNIVVKDYETMGLLYSSIEDKTDSAIKYFEKALTLAPDSKTRKMYYKQLSDLAKKDGDFSRQANWLGKIYATDADATNVVLFNWGLAAFKARDYEKADSVFGIYTSKYADQGYGYYWRARSNAAIDTVMEKGLAIPHYQQLIEVINSDTLSNLDKRWMKEAYGYLGSYEANTEKNYPEAIAYFEKLLELDPENETVIRNIEILQNSLAIDNRNGKENSQ